MGEERGRRRGRRLIRPGPRAEVEEELSFHLEERIRENVERGMPEQEARREAQRRLGDLTSVQRQCEELLRAERREQTRRDWLDDLRRDVQFGVRSMLRAPLFAGLAVLTLALGIGANAAVFGVVKSVLLNALPYQDPDRLVRVYGYWTDGSFDRFTLSAGSVQDIVARQTSFTAVGATTSGSWNAFYTADSRTEVVEVLYVEPSHLEALGTSPLLGRLFRDDDVRDTADVVLLSHAAWQQRFGADRDIVGSSVRIDDVPRTIIGVLPAGFIAPGGATDFFLPLSLQPMLRHPLYSRGTHWLWLYGRLRPGVTLDAARAELGAIGIDLARDHPLDNGSIRMSAEPIRDALVGNTRTPLLMLLASAGLVLLIACANLAGALLSRTISRRREFAVRVSLGAGRGRLIRQLLTESTMLALAGGAAGLVLAAAGLAALRGMSLNALPAYADLSLDAGAVLVTFIVAVVTGVGFGVAPALSLARATPHQALREESRGASESPRARRLRGALVASQVALCLSLLVGAALLARSLQQMMATPYGFDAERLLSVTVPLPGGRYASPEARLAFLEEFSARLRAVPEIEEVAVASTLPTRGGNRDGLAIRDRPWPAGAQTPFISTVTVSDEYFRAMGIPLRSGRTFGPGETLESPRVVVISESMARRYWPAGDAVGAHIRLGPDHEGPWIEVVGVVADIRNDLTLAQPEPMVYYSVRQAPWPSTFVIRTGGAEPLALVNTVRRELEALDAALPLHAVTTMRTILGEGLTPRRLPALLLGAFGALALLLAAVGVYAMFANMAAAREREFGVRMALGSTRGAVAVLVLRQGAAWLAVGIILGLLGVIAVTRALRNMLFGIEPFDAVSIGAALGVLTVCATIALLAPVRRASRVDPASVMR